MILNSTTQSERLDFSNLGVGKVLRRGIRRGLPCWSLRHATEPLALVCPLHSVVETPHHDGRQGRHLVLRIEAFIRSAGLVTHLPPNGQRQQGYRTHDKRHRVEFKKVYKVVCNPFKSFINFMF
jgi:hypothetical protein